MRRITSAEEWSLAQGLSESYPAVAGSLAAVRRAVAALAVEAGATREQIEAIRLATSEALTNAVVHAYGDDPGEIHVTAAVASDELWLLIADDGDGLRPHGRRSGLGLGLALIAQACEELTIVKRSNGGTELRMRFRLGSGRAEAQGPGRAEAEEAESGAAEGGEAERAEADSAEADSAEAEGHPLGSVASANSPASSVFSTTR
ncbi:MAG TPA: ATP-binding protein [Solirubrobacteraceae bacterium]|nr:ATP-binding protein [Solirubrobacteraceae bacterium]